MSFRLPDQQALVCLLAFFAGILFGRNPINRLFGGQTSRLWLITGTTLQSLCAAIASVLVWQSASPDVATDSAHEAWKDAFTFVAMGFMSFSLGLQGAMAKNMNTPFGPTSKSLIILKTRSMDLIVVRNLQLSCQALSLSFSQTLNFSLSDDASIPATASCWAVWL